MRDRLRTPRIDALRALGNAVVPLQGAVAYAYLWDRLHQDVVPADEDREENLKMSSSPLAAVDAETYSDNETGLGMTRP